MHLYDNWLYIHIPIEESERGVSSNGETLNGG